VLLAVRNQDSRLQHKLELFLLQLQQALSGGQPVGDATSSVRHSFGAKLTIGLQVAKGRPALLPQRGT
jgi:hypothetical protein